MDLINAFYAHYLNTVFALAGVKMEYEDYWKMMAENPAAPLLGADKTHPLYGFAGC